MSLAKYLDTASDIITLLILLGSFIGFAFRETISSWIKLKLSNVFNEQFESYKHNLNIELEVYKGSVLRELEQHKANLDIRRAIALKIAEARLEHLTKLLSLLHDYISHCGASPTITFVELEGGESARSELKNLLGEKLDRLNALSAESIVYIPHGIRRELASLIVRTEKLTRTLFPNKDVAEQAYEETLKVFAIVSEKLLNLAYKPPQDIT